MSVDYAAGLSDYDDLGVCGADEVYDKFTDVMAKVDLLAKWITDYRGSCLAHVGAGLSTSAGIPDFRGKDGVWTKLLRKNEQSQCKTISPQQKVDDDNKNESHNLVKPFDETEPTYSHMALKALCELGLMRHIISQNVDGLFLKSGIDRKYISELHGNFYLDECVKCRNRFIRSEASTTMRLQRSTTRCPRDGCKGFLRDTILDWESPIPHNELKVATREAKSAKLHICIGTSLQLSPSKDLVCKKRSKKEKIVVINLQPTKFDEKADLVINYLADDVMKELCKKLDIEVADYGMFNDPTKSSDQIGSSWKR